MRGFLRITLLGALFGLTGALAAGPHNSPTYILDGYDLSGAHGLNAVEVAAKLKPKPGARITASEIHTDTMIVAKELESHHVGGHLFTSLAEKKGHVWIIFDVAMDGTTPQQSTAAGPCAADRAKFCKNVQPGQGRVADCLADHEPLLVPACKARIEAVLKVNEHHKP